MDFPIQTRNITIQSDGTDELIRDASVTVDVGTVFFFFFCQLQSGGY